MLHEPIVLDVNHMMSDVIGFQYGIDPCQLDRLGGGSRERKLQIVRQSVTNSWKSVFPIKGGQAPPREEEPYVVE